MEIFIFIQEKSTRTVWKAHETELKIDGEELSIGCQISVDR